MKTERVYYQTVDVKNSFLPLQANTLEELKAIISERLKFNPDHYSKNITQENKDYWVKYYQSLTFIKITEVSEPVV